MIVSCSADPSRGDNEDRLLREATPLSHVSTGPTRTDGAVFIDVNVPCLPDEFVIMACDGVWDVMANDEACFFLRKSIQEGNRDLGKILEDMEVCMWTQA